MPEYLILILAFLASIVASFIGTTTGGGGLLTIPALMYLGLPPQAAIATDRFGSLGQSISAIYKFGKAKKIQWGYTVPLIAISILGAYIGSNILLSINSESLTKIVALILLILLPALFIKKDLGVKHKNTTLLKQTLGFLAYMAIQIFAGFFGGGTGPFVFYTFMAAFGFTIVESNATATVAWIFLAGTSSIIFAINGLIDYKIGLIMIAGSIIGGWIGAHVSITKGDHWVKRLFIAMIVIIALSLLI
jgi:uncharacterized membrane protein YfcA